MYLGTDLRPTERRLENSPPNSLHEVREGRLVIAMAPTRDENREMRLAGHMRCVAETFEAYDVDGFAAVRLAVVALPGACLRADFVWTLLVALLVVFFPLALVICLAP